MRATRRGLTGGMFTSRVAVVFAAILAVMVSLAWAGSLRADPAEGDEQNPYLWKPQTRSVAVFKNGLGFFMREGEAGLREGWCVAQQVPPAAFGTLAIYAIDEKHVVDIVGSGPGEVVEFDGRDAPSDAAAKRARLEASNNLKIQLHYKQKGQDRTAAGELVSVGPEFAVLDTGTNSVAVPVEGVIKMQILELPLRIHVGGEGPAEKMNLGMAYLRKGITWIPDYTLKVLDEETAELTLRGTIVNEAEDLIHTDVHLVVGVPHFVHTDHMAPIAVGQVIRTIGAAVSMGNGLPNAVRTQIMNRAAIVPDRNASGEAGQVIEQPAGAEGGDLSGTMGNLPQMGGAAATDYTVYTKEDLTLRRGEKAIITLFTTKIKYSHIYRWSPPGQMEHFLVLKNSTDTAWTTGPCLALSEQRPLSEDLLKYTPKGSDGYLPVTAAINIAQSKTEREIERKLNAHTIHTTHFDLVTLEGELKLRNYEKRTVKITVTNPVPGKPLKADHDGALSTDSTKLQLADRAGTITWNVELEPGEETTLKYVYERYVKAN